MQEALAANGENADADLPSDQPSDQHQLKSDESTGAPRHDADAEDGPTGSRSASPLAASPKAPPTAAEPLEASAEAADAMQS